MRNKIIESTIDEVINSTNYSEDFKASFSQYIKNTFDNNAVEEDFQNVIELLDIEEEEE